MYMLYYIVSFHSIKLYMDIKITVLNPYKFTSDFINSQFIKLLKLINCITPKVNRCFRI